MPPSNTDFDPVACLISVLVSCLSPLLDMETCSNVFDEAESHPLRQCCGILEDFVRTGSVAIWHLLLSICLSSSPFSPLFLFMPHELLPSCMHWYSMHATHGWTYGNCVLHHYPHATIGDVQRGSLM